MSLINKELPPRTDNVVTNIDTQLLSTLLNKELNAEGRVFNCKVNYIVASQTWMASVEHFRGTQVRVIPENIFKNETMIALAKELADLLRNAMAQKEDMKDNNPLKKDGKK